MTAAAGIYRMAPRAQAGVLGALPANAFLTATIDVDALRKSPLAEPLFGGAKSAIAGVAQYGDSCGIDLVARLREIALAVPETGDPGDFGIAARIEISQAELEACAEKLTGASGGPTVTGHESGFSLLSPHSKEGSANGGSSRPLLAIRKDGLAVFAQPAWRTAMLRAADGTGESAATRGSAHANLRATVAAPGVPKRTLIATAILPSKLRERLKSQMAEELAPDDDATQPSRANQRMQSVLAVSSAAFALTAGDSEHDAEFVLALRCETPQACADVRTLLLKSRLAWSQDLRLRLAGLGPLIDSFEATLEGSSLRATAQAPAKAIATAFAHIFTPSKGKDGPRSTNFLERATGTNSATEAVEPTSAHRTPGKDGGRGDAGWR